MDLDCQIERGALLVRYGEEQLTKDEADEFKAKVFHELGRHKVNHVVLNVEELQFVDSTGLGALLALFAQLDGGDLKFAGLTAPVRHLGRLVRMEAHFESYRTVEEALSSLSRTSLL